MDKITDTFKDLIEAQKELCDTFQIILNSNIDKKAVKDVYDMMGGYGIDQIMMFSCGILPVELIKNGIKIDHELIKKELIERYKLKKSKMKKPHSRIPGKKKKGG